MSTVSFERETALDLLNSKLRYIQNEINEILNKWNQNSSEEFISKVREGKIEEGEMDALVLTNLLESRKKYEDLLVKIGS